MYLSDIDIDIPYKIKPETIERIMVENSCSYEHAIQKDYEENWKWNIIRRFTLETRCIVSMFLRLMGKVRTQDCSKIVINCVNEEINNDVNSRMGICKVEHYLDYSLFFTKSEYEKKLLTLNIIEKGISRIAEDKNWDFYPFQEIINKIVDLGYNNYWIWGKGVKSPSKLYSAEVHLEHGVKDIKIYICILNKKSEVITKELGIIELPHEFSYARHLGKLVWTSQTEVQLQNKNGGSVFSVQL